MAFVASFRGNVVACPIGMDGRIVRVCSVDCDVSAGSEPRGIVSWDTQLGGPGQGQKNHTLLGNLSQGCLGALGDRMGRSCCSNLRRCHCGGTITIIDQGCQNELYEPRTVAEGADFIHIQPDP